MMVSFRKELKPAEEFSVSWEGMDAEIGEMSRINLAMDRADWFVRKKYLSIMEQAEVIPLDKELCRRIPGSNMRLAKIDSLLFEDPDLVAEKVRNIYGALDGYGETAILVLEGKQDRINLYLGVCSEKSEAVNSLYRTFRSSMESVLPGSECRNVSGSEMEKLLQDILPEQEELNISAVSGISGNREETQRIQGKLNVLIDGMRRKPFTMILLAKAVNRNELALMRQGYERMYTEISPFQKQDLAVSRGVNESFSTSFSDTVSSSMSISSGVSRGYTDTTGMSHGTQKGADHSDMQKSQATMGVAGALISATVSGAAAVAGGAVGAELAGQVLQSLFCGQSVGNLMGNVDRMMGGSSENGASISEGWHEDHSDNYSEQENTTETEGHSETRGSSQTAGTTAGKSLQMTYINKSVDGLLGLIDEQIKKLTLLEGSGAFHFAAYFIAGDRASAMSAANIYRSITMPEGGSCMKSPIYNWEKKKAEVIKQYLKRGIHPLFSFAPETGFPDVTVAQPIGLRDLPNYLSFPLRSVPGLVITRHASFARDVIYKSGSPKAAEEVREIKIGCVYDMGMEDRRTAVRLNMDELTKHLFVTGSTGTGKSNFCYQLLDKLATKGIKLLIVEPAKGEYAKVFGGRQDFHVYGTNMKSAPILQINPFAFPEGIHVIEHMERLLDIFNAAWPMYSAMPAILKDAMEQIYIKKGFDMILGEKPEGAEFPCFEDLLEEIPRVVKMSEYSGEVKGNYIGALVTRVKSLTNGIYGLVFSPEEIGDEILFDGNVIADISRIGSEETKALLMGVLVMRLSEYRMTSGRMNSALRHVTVLEEAHHLLRRQSPSTGEESNMRAASVEMITNAIAEMRTSGEGFIIADQSPSVMDLAVIRNTQTKVIFMLPEREDQRIVGNALSLNEMQQQEIAKLSQGVAVVYQNGWSEALLCKIDYFDDTKMQPFVYQAPLYLPDSNVYIEQCVRVLIGARMGKKRHTMPNEELIGRYLLQDRQLLPERRRYIYDIFSRYREQKNSRTDLKTLTLLLERLLNLRSIFNKNASSWDMDMWERGVRREICEKAALEKEELDLIISAGIRAYMAGKPEVRRLYIKHLLYCDKTTQK